MMDQADLARYLEKWQDTMEFCSEYFTKQSESAAAQHCNPKVFYSPICQRLDEALGEILRIREGIK